MYATQKYTVVLLRSLSGKYHWERHETPYSPRYEFEAEIIKIGQSFHKMYSNKILNFQESTTILNADTKKVWKFIVCTSHV